MTAPVPEKTAGQVRAVRQLRSAVQAEVCVGWSSKGFAWLLIEARGEKVQRAMEALHDALREEASDMLKKAQDYRESRGEKAIGR